MVIQRHERDSSRLYIFFGSCAGAEDDQRAICLAEMPLALLRGLYIVYVKVTNSRLPLFYSLNIDIFTLYAALPSIRSIAYHIRKIPPDIPLRGLSRPSCIGGNGTPAYTRNCECTTFLFRLLLHLLNKPFDAPSGTSLRCQEKKATRSLQSLKPHHPRMPRHQSVPHFSAAGNPVLETSLFSSMKLSKGRYHGANQLS